jgi:hypothetical protein
MSHASRQAQVMAFVPVALLEIEVPLHNARQTTASAARCPHDVNSNRAHASNRRSAPPLFLGPVLGISTVNKIGAFKIGL